MRQILLIVCFVFLTGQSAIKEPLLLNDELLQKLQSTVNNDSTVSDLQKIIGPPYIDLGGAMHIYYYPLMSGGSLIVEASLDDQRILFIKHQETGGDDKVIFKRR